MIWQLLAVFISGLVLGGCAYLVRRLSGNKLPKWIIPVTAGLGMLGYQAYYNYAWYDFKLGQLPERTLVLEEKRNSDFFRPWSYIYPAVNYFTFIDGEARVFEKDGKRLVQYILFEMHQEHLDRLETQYYALDCSKAEQVKITEEGIAESPFIVESVDRSGLLYKKFCL